MKTIALIFGSTDSEHEISIKSAASVFKYFPKDAFHCLPIYIQKNGEWITGDYTLDHFKSGVFPRDRELSFKFKGDHTGLIYADTQEVVAIDGAFIMLHGPSGEGGKVQGLLDLANIPFTGAELTSSALCMDKAFTHQVCEHIGLTMPQYQLVSDYSDVDHDRITYPCVVKPSREGSSFGISFVEDAEALKEAIDHARTFDRRILIEEYIDGQELSVAVLKTKTQRIISKPCQSTRFKPIADFHEKYVSKQQETLFDLPYSLESQELVQKQAEIIFDILDCRHFARIDFFITADERIYFNEINTIPGFTDVSLYPSLIMNEGLSYHELIHELILDIV